MTTRSRYQTDKEIDNKEKIVVKRQKRWLNNGLDRQGDSETRRARMEKREREMRYRL